MKFYYFSFYPVWPRGNLCILVFIILNVNSFISANNQCCPTDQAVLMRSDVCWDPVQNTTTSISLMCKNIVRFRKNITLVDDVLKIELSENFNETIEANQFCMANVTNIKDVNLSQIKLTALVCNEQEQDIVDDRILGYCVIVSVIFLAATTIIYSLLPELRDVQGKSIINFCGCLAIGLGILCIMKLMSYSDMALCATRGFLAYFFVIAAFFWTNAISIQILLSTRRPTGMDYGWREFKWYVMYAWGCPIILTTCMAIVNFHPGKHTKPGIGLNHCWFLTKTLQWIYMYSVMSVLLLTNIIIFIYTSVVIWRSTFHTTSSQLKALKYKFVMSARLIFLMGLPWVFEMIGSLAGKHIIFSIIDVFNTLQGILIFLLLVVFRRRVVKIMYKRGWLDCISGFVERHLAVEDDEENVVQHTDVPMNDTILSN